jgi:hypothetical protein
MTNNQLSSLIKELYSSSAIILGNGINRYANTGCSWLDLLKKLANEYCQDWQIKDIKDGISYTEFFDALEISVLEQTPYNVGLDIEKLTNSKSLQSLSLELKKAHETFELINTFGQELPPFNLDSANKKQVEAFSNELSKMPYGLPENLVTFTMLGEKFGAAVNSKLVTSICREMVSWQCTDIHRRVSKFAEEWNIPILTTNYDTNLEQSINAEVYDYRHDSSSESCTISCCYTTNPAPAIDDFAIWHINGVIKYPKSILIGKTHYVRCLQQIRSLVFPENKLSAEIFTGNNTGFSSMKDTWLELIFSKNLFIIGLQLDTNEDILRWLLLERAKYYALYNNDTRKAWYVTTENEYKSLSNDFGKQLFFKSVGVEILVLPDYKDIYEAISI